MIASHPVYGDLIEESVYGTKRAYVLAERSSYYKRRNDTNKKKDELPGKERS